jgi:polar amino acid transport system substrate-binding protein
MKDRGMMRRAPLRTFAARCLAILLMPGLLAASQPALAEVFIPRFMDPRVRLERPDLASLRVIRFITDDEFPPLHFADPEGGLAGFSVDLSRAICQRLGIACTIQARRFDTLADSLAEGRGDVIAAALPLSPSIRQRFGASQIYHRTPARFVGPEGLASMDPTPQALEGKKVAVVAGSAHSAFLGAFFARADRLEVPELQAGLTLLRLKQADFVFGDAGLLALWLGGRNGAGHRFIGGPWLDSRYFGEGIAFLTRKDDQLIRRALDYGLQQVWDDGTYAKLYLRYFPVGLY